MMQPFFLIEAYPELKPVMKEWEQILVEGLRSIPEMIWIEDERTSDKVWAFAPLQPEEEDRDPELDNLSFYFRSLCPLTVRLVSQIPSILAYGFSLLLAGGIISAHKHTNPFVTAMLVLSVGHSCWITVGSETRQIKTGSILIFDYTLNHEIVNEGNEDRLVLLLLLPNKHSCP